MHTFIRRHAAFGLMAMLLGCCFDSTVEIPDKPAPPPAQLDVPEAQEADQGLTSDAKYDFEFKLPSVDNSEVISSSEFRGLPDRQRVDA